MGVLWKQSSWTGTAGDDITTVTPEVGGSYTNPEGSLKVDEFAHLIRNLSSAAEGSSVLTGYSAPASKQIAIPFNVWSYADYVNQLIEFVIIHDANNKYQIRVTNSDSTHVAMDVYRTVGGSLSNIGQATQIALTSSTDPANSTLNGLITYDWSSTGAPTLKVEAGVNGGAKSTIFNFTSESNSITAASLQFGIFQTNGGGTMRLGGFEVDSLGGVMDVSKNLGDMVVTGTSSVTVPGQVPTGGSGSYTYQWYMSTTYGFTPGAGNLVAGQTGQNGTFTGLAGNTEYWVLRRATDGTTTIDSYYRMVWISGKQTIIYLAIGDSTNRTVDGVDDPTSKSGPAIATYLMQSQFGPRRVVLINSSVAGSASSAWVSGSTNMNAALSALSTQVASFPSATVIATIRIGANDAITAVGSSTYGTNVASMISALTGSGNVSKINLNYPTWIEPGVDFESTGTTFTETQAATLQSYLPILDGLVNNSTVFAGDKLSYRVSASQPASFLHNNTTDGGAVHWNSFGNIMGGGNEAAGITNRTDPAAVAAGAAYIEG